MTVVVQNASKARVSKAFIEGILTKCARHLKMKHKILRGQPEIQVVFLGATAARKLNAQFRGRDYATDVLSFAPVEEGSLGELVLCPPILAKQARQQGWAYRYECGLMLIHGFLHLLGYDHEKANKDAEKMYKLQAHLVRKVLGKKLEW